MPLDLEEREADGLPGAEARQSEVDGQAGPLGHGAAVAVGGGAQRLHLVAREQFPLLGGDGADELGPAGKPPGGGAEGVLAVFVEGADGARGASPGGLAHDGAVLVGELVGPGADIVGGEVPDAGADVGEPGLVVGRLPWRVDGPLGEGGGVPVDGVVVPGAAGDGLAVGADVASGEPGSEDLAGVWGGAHPAEGRR